MLDDAVSEARLGGPSADAGIGIPRTSICCSVDWTLAGKCSRSKVNSCRDRVTHGYQHRVWVLRYDFSRTCDHSRLDKVLLEIPCCRASRALSTWPRHKSKVATLHLKHVDECYWWMICCLKRGGKIVIPLPKPRNIRHKARQGEQHLTHTPDVLDCHLLLQPSVIKHINKQTRLIRNLIQIVNAIAIIMILAKLRLRRLNVINRVNTYTKR